MFAVIGIFPTQTAVKAPITNIVRHFFVQGFGMPCGIVRRPCLLLKNEAGEYDTVALYRSKKEENPLAVAKYHEFSPFYLDEVVKEDGSKITCARSMSFVYHNDKAGPSSLVSQIKPWPDVTIMVQPSSR